MIEELMIDHFANNAVILYLTYIIFCIRYTFCSSRAFRLCKFIRRTRVSWILILHVASAQFTTKDGGREYLPLDAGLRSRRRLVAGVVQRRRPPGVVPRDPNSPRSCPWLVLPLSFRLPHRSSPAENGVSRTSCPPAFMTRPLNFPETQPRTREVRSRGMYY